ncbi:hypothetical protein, partial [Staphylococcus sp. GDY8P85P]|uniref:hypothetical protein n=1 Tax=Staphylococcus sp. GDY8P85P TaxID=2804138 RepID=UPI001AEBF78A
GPSKENFIKKFYKQSKLGVDDEFKRILSHSLFCYLFLSFRISLVLNDGETFSKIYTQRIVCLYNKEASK